MMRPQLILDLNRELIVDNFAGGGGASTGFELALARHVDDAINHDLDALGMHRINHPQTVHHCEDVFDVKPAEIAGKRRVGAAWFSPDCKHFSKAKGGKPLDKKIRGLVLVILRWAKIRPRVVYMENVEEIQTWGPLLHEAKHGPKCNCGEPCGRPDPEHKGRTWQAFLDALSTGVAADHPDLPEMLEVLGKDVTREELVRGFGYTYEVRELRACDYGAPTIRKRLFLIARCDGRPIVWPEQTHFDPKVLPSVRKLRSDAKPWRTVAECIDWGLPCHSIFLTREEARKVNCRRPLAKSTLRRIATGIDRYVLKAKRPFIVSLTHHGAERVEPIDEPGKTITGAHRGEKALVVPFVKQGGHYKSNSKMVKGADEPMRTQATNSEHSLVTAHLAREFGESIGQGADAPAPTVMPAGQGKTALISGSLVRTAHGDVDKNGKKRGRGAHEVTEPMPSALGTPDLAFVAGTLVQTGYGEREGQQPRVPGAEKPLGMVAAHLVEYHSPKRDGDERVKPVDQPAPVQTTEPRFGLVATNLVKLRGDAETHQPGHPVDDPNATISAGGQHHALSACYLAQHNAGFNTTPGHDAREPITSVTSKGSQQQVVAAALHGYYKSEKDGQPVDEALRTATTKPRYGLAEAEAVTPMMTPEQIAGARRVAAFLREHGVVFEGEFATVGGYVIVDIGMRMLTARELFRAQGFPEEYVIDRAWVVDKKTGEVVEVRLTKEQQIRMCGNSVCPPLSAALVRSNSYDLAVGREGHGHARTDTESELHGPRAGVQSLVTSTPT